MKSIIFTGLLLLSFLAAGQFQLNGGASSLGGGTYQLTTAANNQFGAIWYKLQHNLNNNFNVEGQFNFGSDPAGADGITFIMQNSCLSAGGAGGGIGYIGIPGSSMGVEFDTYQNISGTGSELNNDPVFDHIAVEKNGDVAHDGSADDITVPVQMDATLSNVKTGNWYNYKISYNAATKNLQVYFNGSLRVDIIYDLQANIFTSGPWVYWGFASSTGGHNNVHQISINGTTSTHLLADTTICTGTIPVTLNPFTNLRGTNLALKNPAFASTGTAIEAVDGNIGTRWESAFADPQWIYVDLQSPTDIDSVVLYWEGAYGSGYEIQTSNDAVTWTPRFTTTTGDGGKDLIVFSASNVRYVRMYGTVRGTPWGYSLWEFQIYGQPHYLWSPNNGTISPDIYSSTVTLAPTATTTYSVLIPDACLGFTTASMTVTVDCTLPVELVSFTGTEKENHAVLNWTTATEENTHHFEIWKSEDGVNFYFIGNTSAAGSSRTSLHYAFTDASVWTGTAYYKLMVVDSDGSRQESEIILLQHHLKISILNSVFENETQLIFPEGTKHAEISVLNITGQVVAQQTLTNPGTVVLGRELSAGAYVLSVQAGGEMQVFRIVKY